MFQFSLRALLLHFAILALLLTGFFNPSVTWAAIATTVTVAMLIGSSVCYLTSGESRSSRKPLAAFVIAGWIYFTIAFGFYSSDIKKFLVTTISLEAIYARIDSDTEDSTIRDPFAGILTPPYADNETHRCFMLYGQACSTIFVALFAAAVTSVVNAQALKRTQSKGVTAHQPPASETRSNLSVRAQTLRRR